MAKNVIRAVATPEEPATIEETPKPKTVRVYKVGNDTMTSFCGEPVQVSETGREFFDLLAHAKTLVDQNTNLVWPEDAE